MSYIVRAALAGMLNSLWIAAALAATVWLLTRLVPRTNAATRHLLWWAVLALVMLLPFRVADRPATRRFVATPVRIIETALPPAIAAPVHYAVRLPKPAIFPLRIPAGNWLKLVALVWLVFCLAHLLRIAWSFLHLQRIKRSSHAPSDMVLGAFQSWVEVCGIRRPVRILVSGRIASPMATGFWRPAVILPETLLAQFQDRELDHVLLHELAHVARRDDWSNLAARGLTAVAGLHPVAAWALRQIGRERELACDDWVVSMAGEARPYAASLARLFELCGTRYRTVLATGMAGSASHLGERIEILLDGRRQFTPRASHTRVAVTAAALLLLVAVGTRAPRWAVLAQSSPVPSSAARRPVGPVKPQGSFLAALVAAGYRDLPVDEIISLKDHGVTAEFLAGIGESGWGRMTAGEMIELRTHGVSPEYLRQVHEAGFLQVAIRDAVMLHQHGVRPETIAEIHALGFGPYTPGQAIELASHGVPAELFHAAREAGFTRMEASDAISAYSHGVRPGTFRAADEYGSHLSLQQIVRLKQAGVIP